MEWSTTIQYRLDLLMWMMADLATPILSLAIWYSVSQSSTSALTSQEVLSYYILVMLVSTFTMTWRGFIRSWDILNGDIVKHLIRPVGVFWHDIMNTLAENSFKLILPISLFLIGFIAFPQLFIPAVYNWHYWLPFTASLLLAMVLAFWFDLLFGFLAFWFEDAFQIMSLKHALEFLASGVLIPFAFMPNWMQTIFSFLPFRYIISSPVEILLGRITGSDIFFVLATQVAWIGLSLILTKALWVRGLKRYAIPGQ